MHDVVLLQKDEIDDLVLCVLELYKKRRTLPQKRIKTPLTAESSSTSWPPTGGRCMRLS